MTEPLTDGRCEKGGEPRGDFKVGGERGGARLPFTLEKIVRGLIVT